MRDSLPAGRGGPEADAAWGGGRPEGVQNRRKGGTWGGGGQSQQGVWGLCQSGPGEEA